MIKLATSILTADFTNLGRHLDVLAQSGADMVHLDVMDGHFVPNISFGLPVIQSLRKKSSLVFDVHLMISHPRTYIQRFADAGADIITFHVEGCWDADEVFETIDLIKSTGKRVGITLKPVTDIHSVFEFVEHVDQVLIMSVNPGFGGQFFIAESLQRARELRDYADGLGINLDIEMDGGINLSNVRQVLDAGVNVVVVGSGIFDRGDIHVATMDFMKIFEDYR